LIPSRCVSVPTWTIPGQALSSWDSLAIACVLRIESPFYHLLGQSKSSPGEPSPCEPSPSAVPCRKQIRQHVNKFTRCRAER
jgi:hypothetical protein